MLRQIFDPKLDSEEAGKKAFSLHELHTAGFRVPPGFVIPPSVNLAELSLASNSSQLAQAVHAIGGFPVAVRSSANLEDLGGASFADNTKRFSMFRPRAT